MKFKFHLTISLVIVFSFLTVISVRAQHEQHAGQNAPSKVAKHKRMKTVARRAKKTKAATGAKAHTTAKGHRQNGMQGKRHEVHHARPMQHGPTESKAHEGHEIHPAGKAMTEKPRAQQPAAEHQHQA